MHCLYKISGEKNDMPGIWNRSDMVVLSFIISLNILCRTIYNVFKNPTANTKISEFFYSMQCNIPDFI